MTAGASYDLCEILKDGWASSDGTPEIREVNGEEQTVVCQSVENLVYAESREVKFGNYQLGSVTVVKAANPTAPNRDDFIFSTSISEDFNLDGSNSNAGDPGNEKVLENVDLLSEITVTESSKPGWWDLTDITCEGVEETVDLETATATFTLTESGQAVTCTFTNERTPQIQILKFNDLNMDGVQDEGEDGLGGWQFAIYDAQGAQVQSSHTTNDSGVTYFTDLVDGADYDVCEVLQPYWINSNSTPEIREVDGSEETVACQSVENLVYAENRLVEFGNYYDPQGNLSVEKVVDWGNFSPIESQTFEICIQGPSYPTGTEQGACAEADYDGATLLWSNVIVGDYTVTETDPGTEWSVDIAGSPVVVAVGETAEVTVTNTYTPTPQNVTVKKIVHDWGQTVAGDNTFEICLANNGDEYCVEFDENGGMDVIEDVPIGTYQVAETITSDYEWRIFGYPEITVTTNGDNKVVIKNKLKLPKPDIRVCYDKVENNYNLSVTNDGVPGYIGYDIYHESDEITDLGFFEADETKVYEDIDLLGGNEDKLRPFVSLDGETWTQAGDKIKVNPYHTKPCQGDVTVVKEITGFEAEWDQKFNIKVKGGYDYGYPSLL